MHFSSVAKQDGATLSVAGDAGTTSGAQTLVVKDKGVTERMTARVVGSTGYVTGNEAALQDVIGLTKAESKKYAGRWLSFPTSNTGLAELVGGLLSSQVAKELEIGGPYTVGQVRHRGRQEGDGHRRVGRDREREQGPRPAVHPGQRLPAADPRGDERRQRGGTSAIHGVVTFSNWGENKSQSAPSGAFSLLKLVPASSSSSTAG